VSAPELVETTDGVSDWHAVPVDDVADRLHTGRDGLSSAGAAERLAEVGSNRLDDVAPPHLVVVLLEQFRSPLIYILLVATAVTLALGEHVDAAVIGAVLGLNALIGTVQQRQAERSVRALQQLVTARAHVLRQGHEYEIEAAEVVPGDVVLLETGVRVAADLRLVEAASLTIDESLLTGESQAVRKQTAPLASDTPLADRTNLAFAGTVVARGRGRGYVVATAGGTELGRIAEHIRTGESPRTPLQVRLDRFARRIGLIVLIAASVAFVAGVATGERASDMFSFAVALAVSAVPEGLPVVFTITLAIGVRRMAGRRAIIRHLPAVETLGSTTTICSDKTGTLTRNEMRVQEIRTADGRFVTGRPRGAGDDLGPEDLAEHRELYLTVLAGVLASEADAYHTDGILHTRGDPTEAALVRVAAEAGLEPWRLRSEHPVADHLPFESERRHAAVVCTIDDRPTLVVQGAPERVLEMCDRQMRHGRVEPLDRESIARAVEEMAAKGLRVLAFAHRPLPADAAPVVPSEPRHLVFTGLQGMVDPPRDGVPEAVRACHDAGIRVVMITGDHAITAAAIAADIGLQTDGPVLTGADLDRLDEDAMDAALETCQVFARVAPEQKLRIVTAYRRRGEVVAVTGDGVNDAPSLQAADIGIAMGKAGTDVAREAADMILADDDFVTIRAAVEEGRVTFANLRKVTFFLVSTGAAEIVMLLTGLALGWPLILLPAQLLWLNLVTNGLQDVALAFEPGEPGILRQPPRPRREGLVSNLLWERTVIVAVVMAAGTLAVFRWALDATGDVGVARTAAVTTMVFFQAVHVGNCRLEHRSALASPPWANKFLLGSVTVALAVHAAALQLPATQWLLHVEPLTASQWAIAAVTSLSVLVVVEIHKALRSSTERFP
jgi:magnesium-transporting ATPase (P-type)